MQRSAKMCCILKAVLNVDTVKDEWQKNCQVYIVIK